MTEALIGWSGIVSLKQVSRLLLWQTWSQEDDDPVIHAGLQAIDAGAERRRGPHKLPALGK